ncbi:hypothetical protein NPIL_466941 [Nephila pilipes]|uniref:Uncharacterized protein n=1 Tax=Nephila pilipes TaxID=299642 RepID=A0A8X6N034_NEPPI|nr:hypothetical protein NPIL_466941 [Nephila pilipes]
MHFGDPAYLTHQGSNHLNVIHPRRWTGRAGLVAGPPCSLDYNPYELFLCVHIKSPVYASFMDKLKNLIVRLVINVEDIKLKPDIFESI